jgi:hypothetical protein
MDEKMWDKTQRHLNIQAQSDGCSNHLNENLTPSTQAELELNKLHFLYFVFL